MGKPDPGYAGSLPGEHIARDEPTRGIETSQYPEDQKANAILLVAASERGTA